MKKHSTEGKSPKVRKQSSKKAEQQPKQSGVSKQAGLTIGLDLGDKTSQYCALDEHGKVLFERRTATTKKGITQVFGGKGKWRVALEVGTHSPWVSRLLKSYGHEAIVANARQVKLITESSRKSDKLDAQMLARLARLDPELLRPIRHSEQAQGHLLTIRVRAALLEARTGLVNTARGLAKAYGERLAKCDADQMGIEQARELPEVLREALEPLLLQVEVLTEQIQASDRKVEQIARTQYPETTRLKQVSGVGDLIATTYVLTVEDPQRFQRSRDVGCYVGLRPRRSDSGESRPQLRISKEGDPYLRQLLVQAAHYILGWRGPDTDLRRWGLKLAARGGKNAKKRAIVAVARKLAILLHRLWVSGEVYEPLRNSRAQAEAKKKAA
jgi:transposase